MTTTTQDSNTWHPASEVLEFNPETFDLIWNGDCTMFQARPLRWTDDASYAAYQADGCFTDDEPEGCDDCMTFPCSCNTPEEIG